jgi:hypothetical protein
VEGMRNQTLDISIKNIGILDISIKNIRKYQYFVLISRSTNILHLRHLLALIDII